MKNKVFEGKLTVQRENQEDTNYWINFEETDEEESILLDVVLLNMELEKFENRKVRITIEEIE